MIYIDTIPISVYQIAHSYAQAHNEFGVYHKFNIDWIK